METRYVRVGVCVLFSAIPGVRAATTLDVSTATPSNWTVSGGDADNTTPDVISGTSLISLTSDGTLAGTPVMGFNNSRFDGTWAVSHAFTLPADATNPTLMYSGLSADDRAVLFLNGKQIANVASDGAGSGTMALTTGGPGSPFTFTNNTSGTITSGFNVGGANTLSAFINNTTGGRNGTLLPLVGTNGTDFGIAGTITFASGGSGGSTPAASVPVPPAGWAGLAMLLGLTTLGLMRRVRRAAR
ncbi:MAG TPA: hypothetical protein VGI81_09910 [Tepidisphaeraceae bacterium]|jgi:hypothetical protein